MQDTSLLYKFLGIARWKGLFSAFDRYTTSVGDGSIGTGAMLLSIACALTPLFITSFEQSLPISVRQDSPVDVPTLSFGVCAILAILMRRWLSIPFGGDLDSKSTFSLTHTAVALGCIPAVIVLATNPTLFADRHDIIVQNLRDTDAPAVSLSTALIGIAAMALWVAVTEEYIFRALLVSVLLRWKVVRSPRLRAGLAVGASAFLFGAAHVSTWGIPAAIGLAGLGGGFALAYIATKEQIAPVILYHFAFDFLSIVISVFL